MSFNLWTAPQRTILSIYTDTYTSLTSSKAAQSFGPLSTQKIMAQISVALIWITWLVIEPQLVAAHPTAPVWIANVGQWPKEACQFRCQNQRLHINLTNDGLLFEDAANPNQQSQALKFLANPSNSSNSYGLARAAQQFHFYLPHGAFNHVPAFQTVETINRYPLIDCQLQLMDAQRWQSRFHLHPMANPQDIQLQYPQALRMELAPNGNLIVHTAMGIFTSFAPVAYQTAHNAHMPVDGYCPLHCKLNGAAIPVRFELDDEQVLTLAVPGHNPDLDTYIETTTELRFSSYYGSKPHEGIVDLAVHPKQGLYFCCGYTDGKEHPLQQIKPIQAYKGQSEAFVTAFDPEMRALWTTFIGGNENEQPTAIAICPSGKIGITGWTHSANFPVQLSKGQSTILSQAADQQNVFIAMLNPDGTRAWSTLFGGQNADQANGMGCGVNDNVYLAGTTQSPDMPVTPKAFQSIYQFGGSDAFIAQLNANGQLAWSTFLGGAKSDFAQDLALDDAENVYVAGNTHSPNFPVTLISYTASPKVGTMGDAFIAQFAPSGEQKWTVCIGGTQEDQATSLAVDQLRRPIITGYTRSTDFPTSAKAAQPRAKAFTEGFVSQFSAFGEPLWSTFLGGKDHEFAYAIATEPRYNGIWVAGKSRSNDFMTTDNAFQKQPKGQEDAFLTRFSHQGQIVYSTFIGGSGDDQALAVATRNERQAIIAGKTVSADFPVSTNALQTKKAENWDGFIAAIDGDPTIEQALTPARPSTLPPDENVFVFKVVVKDVKCKGGKDGGIDLTISGGTPPYKVVWSNGYEGEDLENVGPGEYYFTVTDSKGLEQNYYHVDARANQDVMATITVKEPKDNIQIAGTTTNPVCTNKSDGQIRLSLTGGQSPYSTVWSNGLTDLNLFNVPAGEYSVTVTDQNGCKAERKFNLSPAVPLVLNLKIDASACANVASSKISAQASGGNAPYSYAWSSGQTTPVIANLSPGNYSLTLTDAKGCTATANGDIPKGENFALNLVAKDADCNSGTNGSISLDLMGGAAPYSYKWSNGNTNQSLINLAAGNYQVTVTDKNGCMAKGGATVNRPPILTLSLTEKQPSCAGKTDGSITAVPKGGSAPITYQWQPAGSNVPSIAQLGAGTYSVTVSDPNGCTATATATLKNPPPLEAKLQINNNSCDGAEVNNQVSVTVKGGTPPYSYAWNNGQNVSILKNLASGSYTVTVTDNGGCTNTQTATIEAVSPLVVNGQTTDILCANTKGSINVQVSGGTSPYTYAWSNGATSASINNVAAGKYSLKITDKRNCLIVNSFEVSDRNVLKIANSKVKAVTCNKGSDGLISVTVSGGKTPYNFAWSNGGQQTEIGSLSAGNYSVSITDANNCVLEQRFEVTHPPMLSAKSSKTDPSCTNGSDGKVNVDLSGGTPPYTISWSNGASTTSLQQLIEGPYTATVNDKNGCTAIVSVMLYRPKPFDLSLSVVQPKCSPANSGTIETKVVGGKAPFTYKWSNGAATANATNVAAGKYSVKVSDAGGCQAEVETTLVAPPPIRVQLSSTNPACGNQANGTVKALVQGGTPPITLAWNNGKSTDILEQLGAGTYTISVSDAVGCTATASATLIQPPALQVSLKPTNVSCGKTNDGKVMVIVSGGKKPYRFQWSNNATNGELTGLAAGSYSLTLTDSSGCTANASATIEQPPALSVAVKGQNLSCSGKDDGQVSAEVTGGKAPVSIKWSNGATTAALQNLKPGAYSVEVKDAFGCIAGGNASLVRPTTLAAKLEKQQISCSDRADGSLKGTVSSGTPPYKWSWSNGQTTESLSALGDGSYSVTVADAQQCTTVLSATLRKPAPLSVEIAKSNISCKATADGKLVTKVSGGRKPYRYQWNTTANAAELTQVGEGNYTVTVTDSSGCTAQASAQLTRPQSMTVSLDAKDLSCGTANDGTITANILGGTEPMTISWSNGAKSKTIQQLPVGNYTVTVKDPNGCEAKSSITLKRPQSLVLQMSKKDVSCADKSDGRVSVSVSSGTPPIQYNWSTGKTASDIFDLSSGTYSVTASDANNCQAVKLIVIAKPAPLKADLKVQAISCGGSGNDGSLRAVVNGGRKPYSFKWSTGALTSDLNALGAGSYSLTVTDSSGCEATSSSQLIKPESMNIAIKSKNLSCGTANDGEATVEITGGAAPFVINWNNGAKTNAIKGLTIGKYNVSVKDGAGCMGKAEASLIRPPSLTLVAKSQSPACHGQTNGSIQLSVSGGTAPFTINWSNGQTSEGLTGLAGGTYTVNVSDSKGCKATGTYKLTSPAALAVNVNPKNLSCEGTADGKLNAKVSGGRPPYRFQWSNGASTADLANLEAGSYQLTVTDSSGCTANATTSLTKPSSLSVSVSGQDVSCAGTNDGLAKVAITGGNPPFVIAWNNGSAAPEIKGLVAGDYSVTVKDAAGCTAKGSVKIAKPNGLSLKGTVTPASCSDKTDGAVRVAISGGTEPFTIAWNNGQSSEALTGLDAGSYTVQVSDSKGCKGTMTLKVSKPAPLKVELSKTDVSCGGTNDGKVNAKVSGGKAPYRLSWSSGQTTAQLAQVGAGNYTLSVTDSSGCSAQQSIEVIKPSGMQVRLNTKPISCFGAKDGSASVQTTGGKEPFSYAWSSGVNTKEAANLKAGSYSVTVSDANQCKTVESITLSEPEQPTIVADKTNICPGDQAKLHVNGEYKAYKWSNGSTSATTAVDKTGNYTVELTGATGCKSVSQAIKITLNNPPELPTISIKGDSLISPRAFKYQWFVNDAPIDDANQPVIVGTVAGEYKVRVTDAFGCASLSKGIQFQPSKAAAGIPDIDVYPNPTRDVVNLMIKKGGSAPAEIIIRSPSGKEIYTKSIEANSGEQMEQVALKKLGGQIGAYPVIIRMNGKEVRASNIRVN
jgi:hypothetical protein